MKTIIVNEKIKKPNFAKFSDESEQKNETETIDSQIIKLMKQNPQITQVEICEITGVRRSTITNHIHKLKETHVIERIGSDRKGCGKIL